MTESQDRPFDAEAYGPRFAELLREPRLNSLGPGTPNDAARPALESLTVETAFAPNEVRDRDMPAACLAGIWLRHDFLDESHQLSQRIETPSGSYWHGLMHRREPDYSNAKHWFRRVGDHAIFSAVRTAAAELASQADTDPAAEFLKSQSTWDPVAFIDLCEKAARGGGSEMLCREIQRREWEVLFDYCYLEAVGK